MRRRWILLTLVAVALVAVTGWLRSYDSADSDVLLHFTTPSESQRRAAIGDGTSLSPILQRVFDPADEFAPMPEPEANDWLAKYHEGGQTFADFVAAEPLRPDQRRHAVYLQPLGDFPAENALRWGQLREFTEAYFLLETKVLPTVKVDESLLVSRVNSHTKKVQWQTAELLQWLEQQLPEDAYCLLGITLTDLYPNGSWNFVFGQATLRQRVGIYSFARFDPAFFDEPRPHDVETLILRRSCRTLAHEIGHMFGMQHCIFFTCVMNGSNHLAESDSRPLHVCPVCLRKLHQSIGFDPLEREQRLLKLYRQLKLADEWNWQERRWTRIANAK